VSDPITVLPLSQPSDPVAQLAVCLDAARVAAERLGIELHTILAAHEPLHQAVAEAPVSARWVSDERECVHHNIGPRMAVQVTLTGEAAEESRRIREAEEAAFKERMARLDAVIAGASNPVGAVDL